MAGPRDPENPAALEGRWPDAIESGDDDEILGEFDDAPLDDEIGDYPSGIQRQLDRESAEIVDVQIVAYGYTDATMSDGSSTTASDQDQIDLSVDPGFTRGPLGLGGPTGSGLMTLEDAVSAQAAMREARIKQPTFATLRRR